MEIKKTAVVAADIGVTEENEAMVSSALVGNDKPDIITWASGTDSYVAGTGDITQERRKAFVYNTGAACLLSVQDVSGAEIPYIIPNAFAREIVFPFVVAKDAVITATNLVAGSNFGALYAEFS